VVVGVFVQHAAGVISANGDELAPFIAQRAKETAQILRAL
jgi:hypothetical protein